MYWGPTLQAMETTASALATRSSKGSMYSGSHCRSQVYSFTSSSLPAALRAIRSSEARIATSFSPPTQQTVTQPLQPATTIFLKSLTFSRISARGFDSPMTIGFLLSLNAEQKKRTPASPSLYSIPGAAPPRKPRGGEMAVAGPLPGKSRGWACPRTCTSIHLILWRKKGVVKYKNPPEFRSPGFPRVKNLLTNPWPVVYTGGYVKKSISPGVTPSRRWSAQGQVCEHPRPFLYVRKKSIIIIS